MATRILGHEHVFNIEVVPDAFLGSKVLQSFVKKNYNTVTKSMCKILPFLDNDVFNRYASFIDNSVCSVKDNIESCINTAKDVFISDDIQVNILMMDMSKMGAGAVAMSLMKQFLQLKAYKDSGYPINIFLACDPRNLEEFWEIADTYKDDIAGVKLYPLIGYFPYDERLNKVYEWCVTNDKPVIYHCSHYNAVHYRGSDIDTLLKGSLFPLEHKHGSKKKKASNFCNPKGFEVVAKAFPDLKMDIAHLGGYDEVEKFMKGKDSWTQTILTLCKTYKNVYTDISYTMSYTKLLPILSDIMGDRSLSSKILYGSDFYMNDIALKTSNFHTPIYEALTVSKWSKLVNNWSKLL